MIFKIITYTFYKRERKKPKMKKFLLQIGVICIIYFIITNPNDAMQYTTNAMDMCFGIIVPTLFPFFVCSGLLIYSGFCNTLSKLFAFCMRPLFLVSPAGASAFVIGIVSGYPLGAITAGELYKNNYITKTEAQRLLAFCNNSGPLFILCSVGLAMYSSLKYGVALYVCHILASVSVGILFRFYRRNDYIAPKTIMTSDEKSIGTIFSISVNNAVSNMLTVCGTVVFFSVVSSLIVSHLPLNNTLYAIFVSLSEFVSGTNLISSLNMDMGIKLILTAFVVGFAGLSVHLQVMAAVSKYELSLKPYIIGKLLHGVLSALFMLIYLKINPITTAVFAASIDRGFAASASYFVVLVIMELIMLLSLMAIKHK